MHCISFLKVISKDDSWLLLTASSYPFFFLNHTIHVIQAKATAELITAAENGDLAAVQNCLKIGADVDTESEDVCKLMMKSYYYQARNHDLIVK